MGYFKNMLIDAMDADIELPVEGSETAFLERFQAETITHPSDGVGGA